MNKVITIVLGTILLLVVLDVLWLNKKVVDLEQVGRVISDRLIKIEEQINYLAFQQDTKVVAPAVGEKEDKEVEVAVKTVTRSLPATSEVFIPLGSGSTSSTEWVDTGAQAYVDASIYPRLKEVYLQASLKANSGTAFARIGAAEISHNTPTSTFKTSNLFQLGSGNRLYIVQLRSENGQEVFLENARLRLVL